MRGFHFMLMYADVPVFALEAECGWVNGDFHFIFVYRVYMSSGF